MPNAKFISCDKLQIATRSRVPNSKHYYQNGAVQPGSMPSGYPTVKLLCNAKGSSVLTCSQRGHFVELRDVASS
eukprot:scaffold16369_cov83-Skeletonema_marinoi.AAC.1